MKRFAFSNNNKKDFNPYYSPNSKKKAKTLPGAVQLAIIKFNPMALVVELTKNAYNDRPAFTAHFGKDVNDKAEWVRPFKLLPFDSNRRMQGVEPPEPMIFDEIYHWRVFIRILSDEEMGDVDTFARMFGRRLAKAFEENISMKWRYPKPTVFVGVRNEGVSSRVSYISTYIMPEAVVEYCRFAFYDAIEDGTLFENTELMNALFPNVTNPSILFDDDDDGDEEDDEEI